MSFAVVPTAVAVYTHRSLCVARPFTNGCRRKHGAQSPRTAWRETTKLRSVGEDKDDASIANSSSFQTEASTTPKAVGGVRDNVPYSIIALLASAGAVETAYLTFSKFAATSVICPIAAGSCDSVLASEYSTLFGLPLSLFGSAAYAAVALLGFVGWRNKASGQEGLNQDWKLALAAGSTLLATTSAYLMYVLFTKLGGEECVWCFTSAALSLSVAAATAFGLRDAPKRGDAAVQSALVATVAAIVLSLGVGAGESSAYIELPYEAHPATAESSDKAIELSKRLKESGAKMYGAFWCSHCFSQKQLFGAGAMSDFPYVECYPKGYATGVELEKACKDAGVEAFPTWRINGEKFEGELTFEEIETVLNGNALSN